VSVAVDPSVIPLGADVLIDYGDGDLQYMRADDTGKGVKGNHIDVCVADHETAINAGVRTATVYWVKEG
jgi:3D (Asp-Asp-Asp) domain-containing protein